MEFLIQNPNDSESVYLVDAILDACKGATRGAGSFAFMSKGGVKLLINDKIFTDFLGRSKFELIVGVDAITDTSAANELNLIRSKYENLSVKAYLPDSARTIFHPKFIWFEKDSGGVIITGSGNLTAGGLRWNVEAFDVNELINSEFNKIKEKWGRFLVCEPEKFHDIDSQEVITLLERNSERKKILKSLTVKKESSASDTIDLNESVIDVDAIPNVVNTMDVLVAEIPKSGSRWKQANFDAQNFINFFGASTEKNNVRVYFFHVNDNGVIGEPEVRPAVTVSSHNYRFELDAASDLPYPEDGRPLGIFVKIAVRTFLYMLLMPGVKEHEEMKKLLDEAVPSPGKKMRRIIFLAHQVKKVWPESPLWKNLDFSEG
ncbi:phospholipase D family protein [Serratia sp. root2]|nr:phospholipase D family protein [Serratia sp. root2]